MLVTFLVVAGGLADQAKALEARIHAVEQELLSKTVK